MKVDMEVGERIRKGLRWGSPKTQKNRDDLPRFSLACRIFMKGGEKAVAYP